MLLVELLSSEEGSSSEHASIVANTVPEVIRLFGDNSGHEIDDEEFDNMFVATVLGEQSASYTIEVR